MYDPHEPTIFPYCIQYLHIQAPLTEAPLSPMAIRTLEIGTPSLLVWRNVPTTATLVGNKGKIVFGGDVLDKQRVMMDRMQAICGTQRGSF